GLKGEDTAAVISYTLSRAEGENAGTYAITPAGDAEQGNYDVVYVPANLTIGAKTLTIVAEAKTQVYGAEAVALTYTSEGLEEGDEITGALTRAEGDDVGTYAISQGTLAAGDNYTIAFTGADYTITAAIVDIPAAPGNKTYNGAVQTADVASADTYTVTNEGGTNAGDYTVVFALKDTANYTWSDGSTTNQTFGWQITAKPVTITVDNATKKHGETDPAFTGSVEGLVDAADLGTVAYGRTNATEEVGVYAGVIVPTYTANANYAVTVTPGTFTIESNKFTVIWLADDGTTVIDSTEVEWGEVPAHADATKTDATGKYAYAFAAWSPAPVAVTESTNYVATFTTSIATPLALPLADPELSSTVVNGSSATVTLDPAGTIDGVSFSASPETATWTAAAGTLAFTGLGWNEGVDWSVSAAQGEAELAETASNAGKFYVKPETSWFTATADDFEDLSDASDATVAYEAESASPEGEMVRVHTKIQVPAGGLPQTPATGSAKVGFAVLQLETDTAPAYYAFGNGAWTKLAGVAPAEGEHDYLAVYDLAADTPTARYYIDGVALYQAVDGGDDVYALPLAATTKSLSSISFASKDMVTDDVVAEYDVSYAAAVGDTPYVEIADALAAQDKDPAKTLALLKKGVGLDAPVSLGAKSEAFVVDYAKGSFTNDTPAVSGLAGYDVAATAGEGAVTNYALAAIVYPIEYVLNGGANAAANTNEYTVETLPVALAAATREGYTFAGWTNNVSADQRVTSIPADTLGAVTNVASWTINDYLLTVNYLYATGGVAATAFTSNVVYDTAYSVDSPAVTGYTADRTVVSGTMGAAPVTVDVTYTVNRYKVKFVDEDGETVLKAETEYDYGTLAADVEKPADPT
ncbi:MAG: InlB B-repeat-containing protein, partial [Kiritimatiellae bacterium]|nr:InlB B-repeat-containing protein [Kiritimatiellia bacterium]